MGRNPPRLLADYITDLAQKPTERFCFNRRRMYIDIRARVSRCTGVYKKKITKAIYPPRPGADGHPSLFSGRAAYNKMRGGGRTDTNKQGNYQLSGSASNYRAGTAATGGDTDRLYTERAARCRNGLAAARPGRT